MAQKTVAVSLLSADLGCIREEVLAFERAGADRLHIDIMDGHFVPNLSFGPDLVSAVRRVTKLPIDAHLMVHSPTQKLIQNFKQAGVDTLTVHIEAVSDPVPILTHIGSHKVLAGLALKPLTKVEDIFPYLSYLGVVLVMTVEPGWGGQKLLQNQVEKVALIKNEIKRQGLTHVLVHVDGGVNAETSPRLSKADVLVSGNFVCKHRSYKEAISLLKKPVAG